MTQENHDHGFVQAFGASRPALFAALCFQAEQVAGEKGFVTSDDIRFEPTPGHDRRILGAVFAHLVRAKVLVKDGYTTSQVASSHRRPIGRFKLAEGRKERA